MLTFSILSGPVTVTRMEYRPNWAIPRYLINMGVVKIKMEVPTTKDVKFQAELLEIEGFSSTAVEFKNTLINFHILLFLKKPLV